MLCLILLFIFLNNQKAFQPITLIFDNYHHNRKVKEPGERQVDSE